MMSKEMLEKIGLPFTVTITRAISTTASYFTLDSTDYDWNGDGTDETTPFKDYTLIVRGMKITTASSASVAAITIDDKTILGVLQGQALTFNYAGTASPTGLTKPVTIPDLFGAPLYIRNRIGVRADVGSGLTGSHVILINGIAVPRRLA